MKYIIFKETKTGYNIDTVAYSEYCESIFNELPANVKMFVGKDWYFDFSDKRSPHDSRVKSMCFEHDGQVNFSVKLTGGHDNALEFKYLNMVSCSTRFKTPEACYGDWIIDEITLAESMLEHKVIFENAIVLIRCADIIYHY